MLKSLKDLNGTQMTGLMLAVGIAVVFLSGIFTPSVLIIDMVSGTDLTAVEDKLVTKVDRTDATLLAGTFYLLGHVLLLGGLVGLWPRGRGGSGVDAVTRTGILVVGVGALSGMVSALLDWAMVLTDRISRDAGIALDDYWRFAQNFNAMDALVEAMLLLALYLGYLFVACGLACRFSGRRKSAAMGIALVCLVALLLTLIGINAAGAEVLMAIAAIAIFPISLWVFALGVWLYREDPELTGEPANA
ncbi:MAG: hypothetical protein OXH20_13835 [bacterium]|nr:hypothetical protein [bacterium]MDE0669420.1 hypothetical protein [bacterium]MYB25480.1 hypothetical protein [Acidimicrobiia bacterium]